MSTTTNPILVVAILPTTPMPEYYLKKWNITSVDLLKARIKDDCERAAKGNYPITMYQMDLAHLERDLGILETKLKEGKWAGIMFGAGLRQVPDDAAPFEAAVNICRKLAPTVPLMFNNGPDTHCAAIERMFGVKLE